MKKLTFILFIFLNVFICAQKKIDAGITNIVCRYQVQFLKDTLNAESSKNEIMALQIGDNISLYKSEQKRKTDSLRRESLKESIKNAQKNASVMMDFSRIPRVNLKHEVYKNGDELRIFDNIVKDQYVYPPHKKIDWKIHDETTNIAGYNCQKATGEYNKRNYTAWFTKEIPVSEGPYTFKGLPGLVLEVYDTKKYFFISLISIQKLNEDIIPINKAIKTTYQDFIRKRKEVDENPVTELQKLSKNPISKEIKDKVIENRKHKNNFLD